MNQKRAHISLRVETLRHLNSIRAPGQSYDGILQELIALWNKNTRKGMRTTSQKVKRK